MTVISLVISSKTAKILFAQQFVLMTHLELEEYVVHFSGGIDSCNGTTHFESDKVRYLFIPIHTLFLIYHSKVEDTNILKLMYRLVQDVCGGVDYGSLTENAFELMNM